MTSLIKIRIASSIDAQAISELMIPLVKEFISYEYTEQGKAVMLTSMTPEIIQSNFEQEYEYFVAEEKDQAIGVLGIKHKDHLFHCFVDKTYHRKQVGQKLWQYWIELAKPERVTVNSSKYAIKFYQALGFKSSREVFEKNGVTCYPMIYEKY